MKNYCRQIWITSTLAGIAQNEQKWLIFIAFPQVRTKMRERVILGQQHQQQQKNLRMTKSKENTLICISTHTHRHLYKYRYTYSHKHIFCSSQIVLFYKLFVLLIESGKLFQIGGTNTRNSFSHICFMNRVFKFRTLFLVPMLQCGVNSKISFR